MENAKSPSERAMTAAPMTIWPLHAPSGLPGLQLEDQSGWTNQTFRWGQAEARRAQARP